MECYFSIVTAIFIVPSKLFPSIICTYLEEIIKYWIDGRNGIFIIVETIEFTSKYRDYIQVRVYAFFYSSAGGGTL